MCRRVAALTPPALLCGLLALLLSPVEARAHRLVVECQVLPEQKVRVEGWYNAPGKPHPAQQATVQVFHADGQILTDGRLDAEGKFTFAYEKAETIRVVVTQTGHRDEVTIPAEKLGATAADPKGEEMPVIASSTTPTLYEWIKDVVIGVGFLLALAAFVMSVRNARRLRERDERDTTNGR